MFQNAIVRTPGENVAEGLTTATLGVPIHTKALEQRRRYVRPMRIAFGRAVAHVKAQRKSPA